MDSRRTKVIVREVEIMQGGEIEILRKFVKIASNRLSYYLDMVVNDMKERMYDSARCGIRQFLAVSDIVRVVLMDTIAHMEKKKGEEEYEE